MTPVTSPSFRCLLQKKSSPNVPFMLCKDAKRERSSAECTKAVAADDCHGDAMGACNARTRPLILWFFLIPALLTIAATVAVQEFEAAAGGVQLEVRAR